MIKYVAENNVIGEIKPLKADAITKDYVKNASIFADIFNY